MSTEQTDRDWPEGRDYTGMCRSCGMRFYGPKRRIMGKECRACATAEEKAADALEQPPSKGTALAAEIRTKTNGKFAGDRNVEVVKAKMDERAKVGFSKYGVTTERPDLSLLDWLRHAQEESMDQVIYLEAAIQKEEARLANQYGDLKPFDGTVNVKLADAQDIEMGHSPDGATSKRMTAESYANSLFSENGGNLS